MITLEIEGVRYTNFLSLGVERSIENVYGTFNFTATYAPSLGFPIKRRSSCRVMVNQTPIITGFVESIDIQYSSDSHTVSVRGSDRTVDVYQSQLDNNVEFTAPISLQNVILKTLATINITNMQVINEAGALADFNAADFVSSKVGETAFSFIENYARKRQVFITTDGLGNIVLARGSSQNIALGGIYNIINDQLKKNNILNSSTSFNDSERFNKYKAISQLNNSAFDQAFDLNDPAFELGGEGPASAVATIAQNTDPAIRNTRVLVFNSESSSNTADLAQRVNWEMNIRRVRSAIYKATVQGATYDGVNPWRVNRLVQVIDDFAGINATLLIRSINFEQSLNSGTTTTLELVVADGYSPDPVQSAQKQQANNLGRVYEITE